MKDYLAYLHSLTKEERKVWNNARLYSLREQKTAIRYCEQRVKKSEELAVKWVNAYASLKRMSNTRINHLERQLRDFVERF